MNGIKHVRCSAYHPCSNGGAEKFVQTIKHGLKACRIEFGNSRQKLNRFLFAYRNTPTVIGRTPSELFLGRRPRTRLDIMKSREIGDIKRLSLLRKMEQYNENMSKGYV